MLGNDTSRTSAWMRPTGRSRARHPHPKHLRRRESETMPRVLLIDDDKRLHELLLTYLEQNGFSVTGAPDGKRGLSALDAETFDIVLLDVMMPGMDGLEVCRRIRQKSRVPILMLTAKGDEPD